MRTSVSLTHARRQVKRLEANDEYSTVRNAKDTLVVSLWFASQTAESDALLLRQQSFLLAEDMLTMLNDVDSARLAERTARYLSTIPDWEPGLLRRWEARAQAKSHRAVHVSRSASGAASSAAADVPCSPHAATTPAASPLYAGVSLVLARDRM